MYQVSLEENKLVESYTILKCGRTILRGIYNKSVGEWEGTRKILNSIIKKKPRTYRVVHNFLDTVSFSFIR